MNGVKGKFLKKLKSIKHDRILQAFSPDGYSDFFSRNENLKANLKNTNEKIDSPKRKKNPVGVGDEETETDTEIHFEIEDKENIEPLRKGNVYGNSKCLRTRNCSSDSGQENCTPLLEIDISSFRPPDMNSGSLFDPNLLAVFHQVVVEHMKLREAEIKSRTKIQEKEEEEEEENPLFGFQENCPPEGSDSVILYTTTLRGIRKTFENCNSIRFLLETFRVKFYERDISMHKEFKEELWRVLDSKALPPKLFIRGRYIGGAEEVLGLHEQGRLRVLFDGVPIDHLAGNPCDGCGGIRFVLCFNCNGSHKIVGEDDEQRICPECNENGLILCPYCC
ncbi:uncharacterized protein At3g28850-like [Momordica charantia]|uniref:Uncharacterized protein At3g28850-like n=1 Tax=Momordica charantia TaxID=3673 RepID=A0A6J1BZ48_MOMCH|nr:uncharacterized protein At3g28850-like [Momordica charantia]